MRLAGKIDMRRPADERIGTHRDVGSTAIEIVQQSDEEYVGVHINENAVEHPLPDDAPEPKHRA